MSDLADALLAGLNCWLLLLNHSTDNNQVEIGNNSKQVLMNDRLANRQCERTRRPPHQQKLLECELFTYYTLRILRPLPPPDLIPIDDDDDDAVAMN